MFRTCKTSLLFAPLAVRVHTGYSTFSFYTPTSIGFSMFCVGNGIINLYEGTELQSVYFITNTKHCIAYLALTQLFPVLVSNPEMYTLCIILLHFV